MNKETFKCTYRDWCINTLHVAFFNQDLSGLVAKSFDLRFLQVLAALQTLNLLVKI